MDEADEEHWQRYEEWARINSGVLTPEEDTPYQIGSQRTVYSKLLRALAAVIVQERVRAKLYVWIRRGGQETLESPHPNGTVDGEQVKTVARALFAGVWNDHAHTARHQHRDSAAVERGACPVCGAAGRAR